jgi:hypothetical protein
MDKDYKPSFTVSATGGTLDTKHTSSGSYFGAEVAFNCGLLQTPVGTVRSKISYGQSDKDGLDLTVIELSPMWTNAIAKDLYLGVGPGIGYVKTDIAGRETSLFAWQLGADLDYRMGALNLGLGVRWQDTRDKAIAPGLRGAENVLVRAKIGMNF